MRLLYILMDEYKSPGGGGLPVQDMLLNALNKSPVFSGAVVDTAGFAATEIKKGGVVPNSYMGEPALALVLSGLIRVFSGGSGAVQISALGPGDCLGISTIFSCGRLTTIPKCAMKTTVAFLTRGRFLKILEDNPRLFERYAVLCNEKIAYLTSKIEFLTTPSCRSRLISFLMQNRDANNTVRLAVPKEKLAAMLGSSRATLFRELKSLSDDGYISAEGRNIVILKPEELYNPPSGSY